MQIQKYPDHDALSKASARRIADALKETPDAFLCFAAGHTQIETLECLVSVIREEGIDTTRAHWVGLDEWVGYGRGDMGSCIQFVDDHFFRPLGISSDQYFFFDGKAADLETQCRQADAWADQYGPLTLALLGVGLNGHLGFNEPGADPEQRSHVVSLAESSIGISSKYFGKEVPVRQGITLGLRDLFAAREVLVQCSGAHKADITRKFLSESPTPQVPASLVQSLAHCTVLLDQGSASLLDA